MFIFYKNIQNMLITYDIGFTIVLINRILSEYRCWMIIKNIREIHT